MKLIQDKEYGGERPLYAIHDTKLEGVTIHVGESSIKETKNIEAVKCRFEGKYVFWETYGFNIDDCYFADTARSSLWYSKDCRMTRCKVDAPKMFRRMEKIYIEDTDFTDGQEMLWDCRNVTLRNVKIQNCDYLFMHTDNVNIKNYRKDGNYAFQYSKNVEIHNAVINSKDAFWEAENVTLVDCEVNGEYLGWYAKNMRLVRCHLTGEQLLCYVDGLTLEDCTFGDDANLLFEYSTVNGNIIGNVTSIKNPTSGTLTVDGKIGELIWDENQKQPADAVVNEKLKD